MSIHSTVIILNASIGEKGSWISDVLSLLEGALASVRRRGAADGASLPSQGILSEDLVFSTAHAVLFEADGRSRLGLDFLLGLFLVHFLFLWYGLVEPFEIVSAELELGHLPADPIAIL